MKTPAPDVSEFFDTISDTYGEKYSGADIFHEYFFQERLSEAVRSVDFGGKRILDIGAGTGTLYDRLLTIDPEIDYYATDISEGMLEHSSIPEDRKFLGKIEEIVFPVSEFDMAYCLGVTTYMNDEDLKATFNRVHDLLAENGMMVVTFTNEDAFDWKSRKLFKLAARQFMPRRAVLGQAFTVFPRKLSHIIEQIKGDFELQEVRYLNHTIFPVNRILKRASIAIAKRIHNMGANSKLKELVSSDFILIMRKI